MKAPVFPRQKADPKNVASIILGGGAGTQLFPLTRRAATPAVRKIFTSLLDICSFHIIRSKNKLFWSFCGCLKNKEMGTLFVF